MLGHHLQQIDDAKFDTSVVRDVIHPLRELRCGRQSTEQQQITRFEKRRVLAEFLNADAAIFKYSSRSIHIADR